MRLTGEAQRLRGLSTVNPSVQPADIEATEYPAGRHIVEFDGRVLPTGFSLVRMQADGFVTTRKIFLGAE